MGQYIAKRIVLMAVILLGVMAATFLISRVLPANPVEMIVGPRPTQEYINQVTKELGLDRPLYKQFVIYVGDVVRGDLGVSLYTKQPILDDLLSRATATIELITISMILIISMGVSFGVASAVRHNTMVDHVSRTMTIAGAALPTFIVGLVLQLLFYGYLDWLPLRARIGAETLLDYPINIVTGFYLIDTLLSGQMPAFVDAVKHLICPVFTQTFVMLPIVTRMTRNMMVEVLGQDYVRTAIAYGIPSKRVYFRYALKATFIPLLTVVGLTFGFLLGGSVVVEFVFDWPGLGGYAVNAIFSNDFPAVMGVTLFISLAYLTINLVVDLLYFVIDPRLRS